MNIESTMRRSDGEHKVVYQDIDSVTELPEQNVHCVHAACFLDDKLIIVYKEEKDTWSLPGGGLEEGESVEEAVVREVYEETSTKVIKQQILGYQNILVPGKPEIQTRSVCLVEEVGPFVSDPDEDITEIKMIDPADYKNYFDWGPIGDRVMERALEVVKKLS